MPMSEQPENNVANQEDNQPVFTIEKLYTKDVSLEVPGAPEVFLTQAQPEIDMQVATEGKQIENGFYECTVTVTITAKLPEDKVLFLNEVAQSGIFRIQNVPQEDLEPILAVACPNILFPYARETVSNMVTRAGFPPVLLAPINFEGMYLQSQVQKDAPVAGHA